MQFSSNDFSIKPVADPGFPVGGAHLVGGGRQLRGGYVSKNLYAKTKESWPLGGRRPPWIR